MKSTILAVCIILVSGPVLPQGVAENMWRQVGAKFGELIRHKGMNCPEGKLAVPKGEDHHGKVYQVFCGTPGVEPLTGQGELIVFRLTFGQAGAFTVAPWHD
jgi:hypothetical protein